MKFLKKLRRPRLDPKRPEAVFREYDHDRGYARYHKFCKSMFQNEIEKESDNLSQYGVEHLTVLSRPEASHYLEGIRAKTDHSIHRENVDHSEILKVSDTEFLKNLFESIFSSTLDRKLKGYFGSEYFLYWFTIFQSLPSPEARRSFLWHCDKGPSHYLKIIVYLNGSEEHGGNTTFLNRQITEKFIETGYIFGPTDARESDLSTLAEKFGIEYQPITWDMSPGSAIVFEPSKILHHGISPTRGARHVLMLCLLPSPMPWHEAFKRTNGEGLSQDYTWHIDADEICQTLLK